MRCTRCRDEGWVCEEHTHEPMGHDGCGGAGDPCPACNGLASPFRQLEARLEAIEAQLTELCGFAPTLLAQKGD